MSSKLEPAIWSRDTGQRISWYDSCQLNIVCMSNIKDICCNPRLHDLVLAGWPPCCATSFVVVVVDVVVVGRTRPWSMPLAILTIRKELHGFLFLCIRVVPFSIIMGLRLAALRAAGAPLETETSETRSNPAVTRHIHSYFSNKILPCVLPLSIDAAITDLLRSCVLSVWAVWMRLWYGNRDRKSFLHQ